MKLIFKTVKLNSISHVQLRTGDRFFPAIRVRNRAPSTTAAKTIPKKCQSSRAISATGKFFWLMDEFQA
ncbi:hypothetical protein CFBP6624_12035 [Agrobacterium tumefaciens]|uniref:Uncharacterized protein n=1 Tax=Agrobacterium tumefaciens TaxID=358 RepID=A0AAE6EKU7_AGRTU|nr:hypothetical protein CFBP6624_12035 [Agrobacterium tumefaciens]